MEENLNKYAFWMPNFITNGYGDGTWYNCSACNFTVHIEKGYNPKKTIEDYNFCPHCGRTIIHQTYKED